MAKANDPASEVAKAIDGAKRVTVALKMPNGIILRLFKNIERREPMPGGGTKTVTQAMAVPGVEVVLFGNRVPIIDGVPIPKCQIIGDYALTPNVDADIFNEWLKQNADSDLVKNRLIFAYESASDIHAIATEYRGTKSGMEPLNPKALPTGIKTADEMSKRATENQVAA